MSVFLQDMDLLAENRSLIHTGKLLRQPDTGFEWSGWSELFVLLFDNYCKSRTEGGGGRAVVIWLLIVMAHSGDDQTERERWGYQVSRQPPSMHFFPLFMPQS
jgi:hypothetical protein